MFQKNRCFLIDNEHMLLALLPVLTSSVSHEEHFEKLESGIGSEFSDEVILL